MHDASSACVCGCHDPRGVIAHAVNAALRVDDVDGAIEAGLLDRDVECTRCSDECRARLHDARTARIAALAARERYRARAERLERRARERAEKRLPPPVNDVSTPTPSALPSAAAAALARAREKAAQRHKP